MCDGLCACVALYDTALDLASTTSDLHLEDILDRYNTNINMLMMTMVVITKPCHRSTTDSQKRTMTAHNNVN